MKTYYYFLFAVIMMLVIAVSGMFSSLVLRQNGVLVSMLLIHLTSLCILCIPLCKGQEDDLSDLDLNFESSDADDDRLLQKMNVKKQLNNEINQDHDDYHHFDVFGADGGIEVFCRNISYKKSSRKNENQLKKALREVAVKKARKKKNLKKNLKNKNEYHHFKLFNCDIFCPSSICPNWERGRIIHDSNHFLDIVCFCLPTPGLTLPGIDLVCLLDLFAWADWDEALLE